MKPRMTLANIGGDEKHLGMLFSVGHLRCGSIRAGRRSAQTSDFLSFPRQSALCHD